MNNNEKFLTFLESVTTDYNASIISGITRAFKLLEANDLMIVEHDIDKVSDEFTEQLSGGMADGKKPSEFDKEQLAAGLMVEMEHTDDPKLALEIAMDHLVEYSDYYELLDDMEDEMSNDDGERGELTEAKKKKRKSKKKKRKSKSIGIGYPSIGGFTGFNDFGGGGFDGGGDGGGGGGGGE